MGLIVGKFVIHTDANMKPVGLFCIEQSLHNRIQSVLQKNSRNTNYSCISIIKYHFQTRQNEMSTEKKLLGSLTLIQNRIFSLYLRIVRGERWRSHSLFSLYLSHFISLCENSDTEIQSVLAFFLENDTLSEPFIPSRLNRMVVPSFIRKHPEISDSYSQYSNTVLEPIT